MYQYEFWYEIESSFRQKLLSKWIIFHIDTEMELLEGKNGLNTLNSGLILVLIQKSAEM